MKSNVKSKRVCWWFLLKLTQKSLILLLSAVMLADTVGATPTNRGLLLAQQPPNSQQNATRAAAERLSQEGSKLYQQGTAESLRQAREKLQEALKLWQQVDDKSGEATTLLGIGSVYDSLGEKRQALTYYNQALPIYRAVGDRAGEATTLNNLGLVYDDLGEKRQALTYYNQALPIARAVGNRGVEAGTLSNIGLVYSSLGEKRQALTYYNQALPIARAVGNRGAEATILNSIGFVYSSLGEKRQALTYYNQALPIRRAIGDKGGEAGTLDNLGTVYSSLGEKQQALSYYNQALPIRRAVGDKGGEAGTLNNLGTVYYDLGEKQQALSYYNQALPILRAVEDREGEATTLNNLGTVYDDLGEKQQALQYYNQALPIARAVGNRGTEATTLNNLGLVYNSLGEKQQALKYYNQALPIARAVGNREGEATILNNLGLVYDDLGEKQQALKYYNQALPIARAVGNREGEARTLNNLGRVYFLLGEKQQALSYYNQALPILRAVGYRTGEATTLNNLGNVYFLLGEKQQALSYYNQALPIARAVGYRTGEANTLFNMANLERSRGNLQQAQTQIQAAIHIIEDLRTKIADQQLRTSYFATVQNYYQFYIDLLLQLHKKDPSKGYDALALHQGERSRARGLIELLTEARADIRNGVDPKLLAIEQQLQQSINAKTQLLQQADTKPNAEETTAKLKREIDNLLSQQKELITLIRTSSPKYAALIYTQPLTLPQIQQQLDQDTLLLEYSLGTEHSYLWAVTPNSLDTYILPGREQIEKVANDFYKNYLTNPGMQGVSTEQTAKVANSLSQLILAPVAGKLGQKRLVIVADGALQQIPFAALNQPFINTNKANNQTTYQPLIVNHEIVNLPSVTALATQRQLLKGRKQAAKTLAILANPVFDANDTRVTGKPTTTIQNLDIRGQIQQSKLKRAARSLNRDGWGALPGTAEEAKAILKLVRASSREQAFDFDANYNWATNKQLSGYRFLHFATHGFADPNNPELSGIVLSLVDKAGQPINGYLQLGDIFNLNLTADLVVLSACETGLGKDVSGEGLVGLTRGLMYAGTERVAVSLWRVDDDATAQLMQEFYKALLQDGKSPTAALREAQLKLWKNPNLNQPLYWAAFTLQGEWR